MSVAVGSAARFKIRKVGWNLNMQEEIKSLLTSVKLPPLSFDLLHKLGDPNCDLESVADSISLDPSLTASLLRICNSAVFGAHEPVATVAEAIGRAGFQSVYMLAATLYGNSCFSGLGASRLDTRRLWQHSVTAAFNTKFVAESAGLDGNALFTAGLLHDIGKIVLAQSVDAAACDFYKPGDVTSLAREAATFGADHAEIGATLLERWKLPPQLVETVRYHHSPTNSSQFQQFVAAATIGNIVTHAAEHPEMISSDCYLDAFFLLDLNPTYMKLWREKFDDSSDMITALSNFSIPTPTQARHSQSIATAR